MSACMNYRANAGLVIGIVWTERGRYTTYLPWNLGQYRKLMLDFHI